MPKSKGILVTFEGTEGVGKSTLIEAIGEELRSRNVPYTATREPGGSPVAEQIRKVILDHPMDPWTELFLYEASRAEHLATIIRPALTRGEVVLCDRYSDSSLAYQGFARGLPWKRVHALNDLATGGLKPHLTVWLDLDPAIGLKHAQVQTRFEDEGVHFQIKVRKGFAKARSEDPKRWLKLKARQSPPSEMADKILKILEKKFKSHFKGKRVG